MGRLRRPEVDDADEAEEDDERLLRLKSSGIPDDAFTRPSESLGDGIGDEPVDIEPVDSSEPAEFDDFCLAFVDNSPPDIVFGRSFVSFIFCSISLFFVIVVCSSTSFFT